MADQRRLEKQRFETWIPNTVRSRVFFGGGGGEVWCQNQEVSRRSDKYETTGATNKLNEKNCFCSCFIFLQDDFGEGTIVFKMVDLNIDIEPPD